MTTQTTTLLSVALALAAGCHVDEKTVPPLVGAGLGDEWTVLDAGCDDCDDWPPVDWPPVDLGTSCALWPDVEPDPEVTVATAPALDCTTRVCLRVPNRGDGDDPGPVCSAFCMSDADCIEGPDSVCPGAMTCQVRLVTGPFADRPMCACADVFEPG